MGIVDVALLVAALVSIGAAQIVIAVVAMYVMHVRMGDVLAEKSYAHFTFDYFERSSFLDFLWRLAAVFVGVTCAVHLVEYMAVTRNIAVRHTEALLCTLFIIEVLGIIAGLRYFFELDAPRLTVLATTSALFYLLFLWFIQWKQLLL